MKKKLIYAGYDLGNSAYSAIIITFITSTYFANAVVGNPQLGQAYLQWTLALSGTFYSIEKLNDYFHLLSQLNPFFYAIDGFRYGFLGQADGSIQVGIIYLLILNIALWFMCYILFEKGYRIKS